MKSILKTRCGCSKMVDIPQYCPPYIYIPLAHPLNVIYHCKECFGTETELEKRKFMHVGYERIHEIDVAIYEEVK